MSLHRIDSTLRTNIRPSACSPRCSAHRFFRASNAVNVNPGSQFHQTLRTAARRRTKDADDIVGPYGPALQQRFARAATRGELEAPCCAFCPRNSFFRTYDPWRKYRHIGQSGFLDSDPRAPITAAWGHLRSDNRDSNVAGSASASDQRSCFRLPGMVPRGKMNGEFYACKRIRARSSGPRLLWQALPYLSRRQLPRSAWRLLPRPRRPSLQPPARILLSLPELAEYPDLRRSKLPVGTCKRRPTSHDLHY